MLIIATVAAVEVMEEVEDADLDNNGVYKGNKLDG